MPSGKIKSLKTAILAVLGVAAGSGLLAADAAARVLAPRDEEELAAPLLLAPPQLDPSELFAHSSHRSHQSHSSHRSHSSSSHSSHYSSASSTGSGGSRSGGGGGHTVHQPDVVVPPPKPAKVSFVALPGGTIFVDGKRVGKDETSVLTLQAGPHAIKVENEFLGAHEQQVILTSAQSGTVKIEW